MTTQEAPGDAIAGLDAFAARVDGDLIRPGNPEYDAARQVENARYDRRPAAIVRVRTASDVAATIRLARDSGRRLAVRAGGHSVAGHSAADDAIVLDLSLMRRIEIDAERRLAWAEAGVTARQYTIAAHAAGLATPFGDTGSVGVAGLTLGGGIGWLVRKHGLTIDSLVAAEVITADGHQLRASEDENADLFWALRGGGGNFGVVTRFQFRLHPIDTVAAGTIILPATTEVLRELVPAALAAPDELAIQAVIGRAPDDPSIPPEVHGTLIVDLEVLYAGPLTDSELALAPLRALAPAIKDSVEAKPYPALYPESSGEREGWFARAMFADTLDDELIGAIRARLADPTAPQAVLEVRVLGGAMARVPVEATAFGYRDRRVLMWLITWFTDLTQAAQHEAWLTDFWSEIRHKATGVYVNFLEAEGDERVRAAYPPQTYARLAEIKRRYDPENLFRLNQNIQPAPAERVGRTP
ncbi:MAG: FAD-binding oxidoreductase [Chloroflexota bacterium]